MIRIHRKRAPAPRPSTQRKTIHHAQGGLVFDHNFSDDNSIRALGYYGTRQVVQYLANPSVRDPRAPAASWTSIGTSVAVNCASAPRGTAGWSTLRIDPGYRVRPDE